MTIRTIAQTWFAAALALAAVAHAGPAVWPTLETENRMELRVDDVRAYHAAIQAAMLAGLFDEITPQQRANAREELAKAAKILGRRRTWLDFAPAQMQSLVEHHNAVVAMLGLNASDHLACIKTPLVGTRIPGAVCAAVTLDRSRNGS